MKVSKPSKRREANSTKEHKDGAIIKIQESIGLLYEWGHHYVNFASYALDVHLDVESYIARW